jgi:hypothetical protein
MNANLNRGSARIYHFPVGGRAALGTHRHEKPEAASESVGEHSLVLCSGSWYHEAAIQDAKQARES